MRRWAVQKDLRRRVGEHRKCIGHLPPTSILICLLEGYQQKRKPVQCALYLASQELVGNLADLESHQPQVALLSVPAAPFSAALELEGGRVGTETPRESEELSRTVPCGGGQPGLPKA